MTTSTSRPLAELTSAGLAQRFRYRLEFQRASDGKHFDAGFMDASWAEFWWEQAIFQAQRAGVIGADSANAIIAEHPQLLEVQDGSLKGIGISVSDGEISPETQFELASAFSAPGELALKKLVDAKLLTPDDKATFKVFAAPLQELEQAPSSSVKATIKRDPLPLLEGHLEDYLIHAEPTGEMNDKDHPLFLKRGLFGKAREYCFKTGRQEGGAMLVARMYQQLKPKPEIFAVVHGVMELRHAKQSLFGFEPTAETFADLNSKLSLRRSRLGFPDEMPAVLMHNHPFEPSVRDDGEANCTSCPIQQECQLTSSFYSASDVNFHLSMYGRQPFVAGIVIGLTPRQEDDVRMFCLDGTRTREREFYWIE